MGCGAHDIPTGILNTLNMIESCLSPPDLNLDPVRWANTMSFAAIFEGSLFPDNSALPFLPTPRTHDNHSDPIGEMRLLTQNQQKSGRHIPDLYSAEFPDDSAFSHTSKWR